MEFQTVKLFANTERQCGKTDFFKLEHNVLHKTSKGIREMNYQDTTQFERATMPKLPIQPLLVLCGVSNCPLFYQLINI